MDLEQLRALYQESNLEEAWALYREMAEMTEAGPELHLLGARVAQYHRDLFAARWTIDKALEGCPAGELLGQVRFAAGVICRELGDIGIAIDHWREFIADSREYPLVWEMAEGHAWYNLALALRQQQQYEEALDAYHRAASAHRRNGLNTSLCETLHNLAWTACMVGNRALALESLVEAHPLATTPHLRLHQRLGEAFAGILGNQEDHAWAMQICEELVDAYSDIPHSVRSHACWLAGQMALRMGQLDQAEALAKQAVHHGSLDRSESRCLRDASELLREVRGRRIELQSGA